MGEPYNKLVRDGIPAYLDSKGIPYEMRIASDSEYQQALVDKLVEEVAEFSGEPTSEELADVLEVIAALQALPQYQNVETVQAEKFTARGGFAKRQIVKGEK
jgi:predicted house-cleaning noncanonical NTP pyrophosphatase (MazG superfamily)